MHIEQLIIRTIMGFGVAVVLGIAFLTAVDAQRPPMLTEVRMGHAR